MSVSGMFLKKVIFINPHKTLREIINIMDLLGFSYTIDPVTSESQGFQLGIHDPTCNSDFCMYILDKPKIEYMADDDFSWISPNLYVSILIEDLSDNEDSVLKILHEYLQIHPDEYFYTEENWFYNKDDIEKIYESGKWLHWCYKKPH